jgi:subtilisin family serine protease
MVKQTFRIPKKVSASLAPLLDPEAQGDGAVPAGLSLASEEAESEAPAPIPVLLESKDPEAVCRDLGDLASCQQVKLLGGGFMSAQLGRGALELLASHQGVYRIVTQKESLPSLNKVLPDIHAISQDGKRSFPEDGTGVLIGVVDTGFDLTHPMFRDANGKLRVEGLLDQVDGKEFDAEGVEHAWASGDKPGADKDGHGTHVACIAGGTGFQSCEGIAPGARFLLVRSNFRETPAAVSWVFEKANGRPCVANLSFGRHSGAHDGTDFEERFHGQFTGPGKIVVIAAGNDREENLHVGAHFQPGQAEEIAFDLLPRVRPSATLNFWHPKKDRFDVSLVSPSGEVYPAPALEQTDVYGSTRMDLRFSRRRYDLSKLVQVQIVIDFRAEAFRPQDLSNWKVRVSCRKAVVGRLDGWFHLKGYARFRSHPLVERSRTLGVPATGESCLAVASHVSRNAWSRDAGDTLDSLVVPGRSSSFSGQGPTRDGRWKPDLSAPGQYVTAGLAAESKMARLDERALVNSRLVTLEGTSMAAPVVTGIVALLLQKKPSLDLAEVRQVLRSAARHDAHTGPADWDPAYGHGKADAAAALSKL